MDRGLLTRALVIGLACFILALVGFYLVFSWESWRNSQIPVIYDGPYPNRDPFAGGDIFLAVLLAIIIELALLPVLAGSAAALALPDQKVTKNDLSRCTGLAGAIPLALVSIVFWVMFIASLIQTIDGGSGQWALGQAWLYFLGLILNVLIILAGAFTAGISGQLAWTIRRRVVGCR